MKRTPNPRRHHHRLKPKVFIAVEGETEKEYFNQLACLLRDSVTIKVFRGKHSNAGSVLKAMRERLNNEDALGTADEAWIVVDRDDNSNTVTQMDALSAWAEKNVKYHLAVSHPCFELWLLLHDGEVQPGGVQTTADCQNQWKRKLPDYDKHLPKNWVSEDRIQLALNQAKKWGMDKQCSSKCWPQNSGVTAVCFLVERLFKKKQ